MINPHGGKLIDKNLSQIECQKIIEHLPEYKKIIIDEEQIKDVINIANGVYSPLEGFLGKDDFERVVKEMRLKNGTVWPIPIVLDIDGEKYAEIKEEKSVILTDSGSNAVAVLKDIEIFPYNKDEFAKEVFKTTDKNHPGVDDVYKMGDYLVGGEINLLNFNFPFFPDHNFSPKETRDIFEKRGWKNIVAFQTRNVPHMGHEYLQKRALEKVDGLFIQPVIGKKKIQDFKDEYIIASYEILIDNYYDKNKTFLGILPLKMRYAGPREAVLHAIIRKNFGCNYFIVGRDHAGVGKYYGQFDAQKIFEQFKEDEIGVKIMKFEEVVYCPICQRHVFTDECSHENRISFSGTEMREAIKNKKHPPFYVMREKVYNLLINSYNSLVDDMYQNNNNKKGFVLWFTGLSQSGKTTIADGVYEELKKINFNAERLDGDIIREHLSKDLGFTKEDRNENIRRVGFVSKLLSRNGVGVIASFISPYKEQRQKLREETENYIEVFCDSSLEVCEKRDTKGLYEKARKGEIAYFTGISDSFENPDKPELILDTSKKECIEKNIQKVLEYLKEKMFI